MCPGCGVAGAFDCSLILLPLIAALGWYAIYRVWKQYFRHKPVASVRQIIRLIGYALFVAAVAFCTYLLFLFIYAAVIYGIPL